MISSDQILTCVEENIAGSEKFIVDISVKSGNRIKVEIDSPLGININDCKTVHRFIETKFNRDVEDYELTVSSPGLEEPFKILKQYQKNSGRLVRVVLKAGDVCEGKLSDVNNSGIELTQEIKEKINGKKQITIKQIPLTFEQIKTTRLMLNFPLARN